jgi:hypothetical protein
MFESKPSRNYGATIRQDMQSALKRAIFEGGTAELCGTSGDAA